MKTLFLRVHFQFVKWICVLLLVGLFGAGCREKKTPEESAAVSPRETAPAEPIAKAKTPPLRSERLEQPVGQEPVSVEVKKEDAMPTPFRVATLIDLGGGQMVAGLSADEPGVHHMVRVGDSFRGYRVVEIDPADEAVFMEREGKLYVARLSPGEISTEAASPESGEWPSVLNEETLASQPREQFEPTEDELRRGIDPNDPETWPPGYRGPAIERAMAGREEKFEPTEDELRRGIDPNDPTTWPPGYRGPGIERAMQEAGME